MRIRKKQQESKVRGDWPVTIVTHRVRGGPSRIGFIQAPPGAIDALRASDIRAVIAEKNGVSVEDIELDGSWGDKLKGDTELIHGYDASLKPEST